MGGKTLQQGAAPSHLHVSTFRKHETGTAKMAGMVFQARHRRIAAQICRYLSSNADDIIQPEYPTSLRAKMLIAPAIRDSLSMDSRTSSSDCSARRLSWTRRLRASFHVSNTT